MEKSNIITVAWTGIINTQPPKTYISVRPSRYSYDIIKETGEFVVNLTTKDLVWETDYCGVKSGRDIDKFKEEIITAKVVEIDDLARLVVEINSKKQAIFHGEIQIIGMEQLEV